MRILLVGAGGVGGGVRGHRRPARLLRGDRGRRLRPRPAPSRRRAGDDRFVAAQVDASRRRVGRRRCAASTAITHVMNAVDPRFVMPIFDGAFAAGADYLDMAMCLSQPHPEAPYEQAGVKLGDEQFAAGRRLGGARAGSPSSASASSRGSPTCSRATPPTTCSPRSTSSAPATAPTWSSATTATSLRAVVLDLDDDRGVPQPAGDLESERPRRLVHDAAVQRARGLRLPRGHRAGRVRQRRARGGAAHAALGRLQARDVQVRPRRRVHRRPQTLHKLGLDRTEKVRVGGRRGRPRDVVAACLPDPATLGRRDARQDLRRALGHRHGQGRRAALDVPLPRGRQRVVDARVRPPVRGLADGGQPRRRARAARRRAPGRAPACSAPRPSTPCRSSTCSPSYGSPRGASARS